MVHRRQGSPLTPRIVGACCQVSRSTVLKWIKDKGLRAYKLPGGHYRINVEDFGDFVDRYHLAIDERIFESNMEGRR